VVFHAESIVNDNLAQSNFNLIDLFVNKITNEKIGARATHLY
jgi:hypothetical protein